MGFPTDASTTSSLSTSALTAQVAGGVLGAYGAYSRSVADRSGLNYQAQVQENAAQISDWRATDAIKRGTIQESAARLKAGQVAGTQRATLAARSLDTGVGSAYNILADTKYMSDVDAATIHDNTAKEAWALRTSAGVERANAGALRIRAGMESPGWALTNSLLTSSGSVAKSWYRLRGRNGDISPDDYMG